MTAATKKPRKAAPITDKEILDHLHKHGGSATLDNDWWIVYDSKGVEYGAKYLRNAAFRAIRAERKGAGK